MNQLLNHAVSSSPIWGSNKHHIKLKCLFKIRYKKLNPAPAGFLLKNKPNLAPKNVENFLGSQSGKKW